MDISLLAQQCAPQVALPTLQAVIRTESGFNPLAININGGRRLVRQPKDKAQAISWAQWLIARGYSIDVGLMQINSANLRRLNMPVQDAFEPCMNIRTGAQILVDGYRRGLRAGYTGTPALAAALSAYNTGDLTKGMKNGYVGKVMKMALRDAPVLTKETVVIARANLAPQDASSAVIGFGSSAPAQFAKGTSW